MATEKLEIVIETTDRGASTGLNSLSVMLGNLASGALTAGIAAVAGAARGAFDLLTTGFQFALGEAMEAEAGIAQLEAVLKSTGEAAGVSSQMAQDLASSLSEVTRFSDDAVLAAENVMLTFTAVSSEVFPEAIQTALDMSQALGQDLQSSVIQLGKALQDPVSGVSALARVGVNFNDVQKEMIKGMVEAGDVMGAQQLILEELAKEFGGSAVASAQTFSGQIDVLKNSIANVAEGIGTAFLPTLKEMAGKLIEFVRSDQFEAWVAKVSDWLLNELPVAIEKTSRFWSEELQPALAELWPILRDQVIPLLVEVGRILGVVLPPVIQAFTAGWNLQIAAFELATAPLRNFIDALKLLVGTIKGLEWVQIGKDMMVGIAEGIVAMQQIPIQALMNLGQKMIEGIKNFLGIASPSQVMADQVGRQMALGIEQGLVRGMAGVTATAQLALGPQVMQMAQIGPMGGGGAQLGPQRGGMQFVYAPMISTASEAELEFKLKPVVQKWVRDELARGRW